MPEQTIRVFLGYDEREAAGFHVCVQSLIERSSLPLTIFPLSGDKRDGTNAFVYSRFLVPLLCGFKGWALFADGSDMLFLRDPAELWALRSDDYAVQVVKHNYLTRHSRKYVGTIMESENRDYFRKNWSSLMLMNCAHPANSVLTEDYVSNATGSQLHRFCWCLEDQIGALPHWWNVLIGEEGEGRDCAVAHYTLGIPAMNAYATCRHADLWWATHARSHRAGG